MGIEMLQALGDGLTAQYGRAAWIVLVVSFLVYELRRHPTA